MTNPSIANRFRDRRGKVLGKQIQALAAKYSRPISVLDLGGRADYWHNVGVENISRIDVLNNNPDDYVEPTLSSLPVQLFNAMVGDACNLSSMADQSYDLVHSNSVIEHVGSWSHMQAMAREARRVGRSGWIQTPAWSFPIEPHFKAPFIHWFARPLQSRLLSLSVMSSYRHADLATRRLHTERINLLSRSEFEELFPNCDLYVERVIVAKSYVARWMPDGRTHA